MSNSIEGEGVLDMVERSTPLIAYYSLEGSLVLSVALDDFDCCMCVCCFFFDL